MKRVLGWDGGRGISKDRTKDKRSKWTYSKVMEDVVQTIPNKRKNTKDVRPTKSTQTKLSSERNCRTGSVTKEIDKYISKILLEYVGKTPYYVKNSAHFAEKIKDLTVEEDEVLVSYDVTALYPSVPQDEALDIIYQTLSQDEDLKNKTTMTAENVITLLKICVSQTYFVFNKKLCVQVDGLAIGASTSGPAAELFMERLEIRAIREFPPSGNTVWRMHKVLTITMVTN